MSLFVNTNVQSLNAQRNLGNATDRLATSYERLSSGKRINSAKDDAAGYVVTSRMTSQINGLNQAARNANDGISLAQTADGAMEETENMLQRMRVLAVQSANGSNTANDRAALDKEFGELKDEIDRVAENTTFAGEKILTKSGALRGAGTGLNFQVGADANQNINITLGQGMSTGAGGLTISDATIATATQAQAAILKMDSALTKVTTERANLGAKQNRFSSTIRNLNNISENMSASKSRIEDTDFAKESAAMARNSVMQQAASSMLSKANQQPQIAMRLLQG